MRGDQQWHLKTLSLSLFLLSIINHLNTHTHTYIIDCTIGNAVQNISSSSVRSRDKIASPELPKFAEMLLENDVAFITP